MSSVESDSGALPDQEIDQDENMKTAIEVDGEEMEDLFGDESDRDSQDEDAEQAVSEDRGTVQDRLDDDEDEQAMYNRKFYGDNVDNSDGEGSQREFREADVDVIKHIVPYSTAPKEGEKGIFYAKMPQFLTIDPIPFDPPAFQEKLEQRASHLASKEDQVDDRLIDENTVRWRYSRDSNQRVFKESNAQIVQWSDGTYSLRLGDEYTDVLINDTDNTYLAVSHEQQELIQSVRGGNISKTMMFIPTSTNSKSHQRLTKAVARKEEREHQGPNTYILRVDPELEQKELEKKQSQIVRERRKRQLREQQEREGLDSPEPSGMMSKSRGMSSKRQSSYDRNQYDEYEDDGFMVDDEDENEGENQDDEDEEEEEEEELAGDESDNDDINAERLKQLKRSGASQYREDVSGDDKGGDQNENDDENDDGSGLKRRKVALLDEEDE
ncbi:LANO_0H22166g1_1 [Lachancea nothofagi CBS 11611]|uniref:LANO_0H22166g1_1 n=1 Tax=Lachancea nothofagi CBS 11611 TaxID=1266666 RepID=A0A1G4KNL7_9SACH|nr:LANO_0H22166g1_1 [Lachancea nothofagi CBS 11611]